MMHPKIMRYKNLDLLYNKKYSQLKIKVALNWFEIFSLLVATFLIALKTFSWLKIGDLSITIVSTLIITFLTTYLFSIFRKYQLKITRFDKEDMYRDICRELINKAKV
jgi:hypothetical protein